MRDHTDSLEKACSHTCSQSTWTQSDAIHQLALASLRTITERVAIVEHFRSRETTPWREAAVNIAAKPRESSRPIRTRVKKIERVDNLQIPSPLLCLTAKYPRGDSCEGLLFFRIHVIDGNIIQNIKQYKDYIYFIIIDFILLLIVHCLIIHLNILYFAFETRFYDTSLASMRKVKRRSPSWQNFSEKRFSRVTDLDMDDVFFRCAGPRGETNAQSLSLYLPFRDFIFLGDCLQYPIGIFQWKVPCCVFGCAILTIRHSEVCSFEISKIR